MPRDPCPNKMGGEQNRHKNGCAENYVLAEGYNRRRNERSATQVVSAQRVAQPGEGIEDRLLQAEMLREFGQTSRALGNSADARLAWREAAESFEGVGAQYEAAEINALIASLPV